MADYLYSPDGITPTDDQIKSASYIIGYYKDKLTASRLADFRSRAESYWKERFLFENENPYNGVERLYTDEKSYNIAKSCVESVFNNQDIQELLHPEGLTEQPYSSNETAILLDIEVNIEGFDPIIYKLKAKLDNFVIDKETDTITINDVKTCSKPLNEFDPIKYSYNREIAFYAYLLNMVAKKIFGIDKPTIKGNFLTVSTIPEYESCVYPMTSDLFRKGTYEFMYLLKCVAYLNIVKGYEFAV